MKSLAFFTLLLLPTTEVLSQSSYYPLGAGDKWVYWEYGQWGGVWDTITATVDNDTIIGGKPYKIRTEESSHYQYKITSFERVDLSGDVFVWDASSGKESLRYRLSDTSRSWWPSEDGRLSRFDSCVVEDTFGQPRNVLYIGGYNSTDTSLWAQVLLVDSIGYYTTRFFGIIDGTSPAVLHEARINGVFYGAPPGITPTQDFYPLEVGNRWNYHRSTTYYNQFYDTSNVEIRVLGDTLMPNGRVYAHLSHPDVLSASFVRSDSNFLYYYSPDDSTEAAMYNIHDSSGTRDTVRWLGGSVPFSVVGSVTARSILGAQRVCRDYALGGLVFFDVTLTQGIGISRGVDMGDGSPYVTTWTLRGAVIRDTVYGLVAGVAEEENHPAAFVLFQNYPNPFNPSTTIGYALPHRSHVTLTVYNTLGQQVATLVNQDMKAGYHHVRFDASNMASGVYFYRLQAAEYVQTRKLCFIR